jgi:hypothetical protein
MILSTLPPSHISARDAEHDNNNDDNTTPPRGEARRYDCMSKWRGVSMRAASAPSIPGGQNFSERFRLANE